MNEMSEGEKEHLVWRGDMMVLKKCMKKNI